MRRSLARSVLATYVLIAVGVCYAQPYVPPTQTPPSAQTPTATQFNLWWYSDSALATFLQTSHSGVTMIAPGNQPDSRAPTIKAKGYAIMGGIGGGSAEQAQSNLAGGLSTLEAAIDRIAAEGATYIFVDEPWAAPGQSTATSAASIAYNVKGYNILYNYIHTKYPNVQFGLTIGGDGGPPLHLAMLKAGLKEDFASAEYYNSCCTHTNPFVADGQTTQFPNVKTMILAYHTETLCQTNAAGTGPWITTNGVNIWAFWDVDNNGTWIGPTFDGSWLQNVETFASTRSVQSFCILPYAFDTNYTYTTQTKNFTHNVWDRFYRSSTPYKIDTTQCQYEVMSGANALKGPNDPSVKVTLPWTNRPCNGNFTVTVGTKGNCNVIGSFTCLVFVRNYTTTRLVGNMSYNAYSIDF
jgi:hypothetical protein